MGYRVSTAIFALLFAVMVVKDLTRSEPELFPSEPVRVDRAYPETAPPPVDPVAGEGTDTNPWTGRDLHTEASGEPALDLTIRLLIRRGFPSWSKTLPRLLARREEIVPILEGWLRRREELWRTGVELRHVPYAYAKLAGAPALPLLEELLTDPPSRWHNAHLEALTRVDDPAAVAALRRYHEELPANTPPVACRYLASGTPGFRELLREWARVPPKKVPGLRLRSLWAWFQFGTMGDREEVWELLDEDERFVCLGSFATWNLGGPWPERVAVAVTAVLGGLDREQRVLGIRVAIAAAAHVDPDLLNEAERVLMHEIEAAEGRPEGEKPTHASLLELRERLGQKRREIDVERRRRDLLMPR